jgi:hypothetical protein
LLAANGEIPSSNSNSEVFRPARKIELSRYGIIHPVQIVASDSYIYLTDDFTKTIYKLDSEGALISQKNDFTNQKFWPYGLTLDFDYLYFTDQNKGSILKVAKALDLQQVYCVSFNNQENLLIEPQGISLGNNKDLYITDSGSHTITIINLLGGAAEQFGRFGYSAETFQEPSDVAIDGYGNIYVADNGNKTLKVFDQQKNLLQTYSGFRSITGIFWQKDPTPRIYIADPSDGKVLTIENAKTTVILGDYQGEEIRPVDLYIENNRLYLLDNVQRVIWVYARN